MERLSKFDDDPVYPDPIFEYCSVAAAGAGGSSVQPLIIDNGSYKCRIGWASDAHPRMVFRNVLARLRTKKSPEMEILIGSDIANLEVVRSQLKSAFDRNVVTQFDMQEMVLDYMFSHMGIDTEEHVEHAIVMTEPLLNPGYCRDKMSELLFECYHVPSVAYGIDSLFSLYADTVRHDPPLPSSLPSSLPSIHSTITGDSLVISCGYYVTHVLPVLAGKLQMDKCRRINVGGATLDTFLLRTLQLKYPGHLASLTLSRAEELVRRRCHMAIDFEAELCQWMSDEYYNENVYKVQLPYTQVAAASVSAEQLRDRREQQARRLREINLKRRQEKLAVEVVSLQQLIAAQETLNDDDFDDDDDEAKQRVLDDVGLSSVSELQQAIERLSVSIQKLKDKLSASESASGTLLNAEESKEEIASGPAAKRSRLTKTDTPPQNKRPKSSEPKLNIPRMPAENNKAAMDCWLETLRNQRTDILKCQADRRQRRSEMTKRRTHASQNRMKLLTELAQHASAGSKKKEDTFGMNEEDWNIYKHISKEGGDSDSEAESDRLDEIDSYLKVYDPLFKNPNEAEVQFDIAEYYRLHIALEQIRIPELLFKPSMVGIDQAGLAETIQFVLRKFSDDDQKRLVQNVFLTGSCASIPRFAERLSKELMEMLPFQSAFNVRVANDPVLDSWHGAKMWASSPEFTNCSVTIAEYQERGGAYLREHCASNRGTDADSV